MVFFFFFLAKRQPDETKERGSAYIVAEVLKC